MAEPFYTIGHSTHSIEEFVDLLRSAGVSFVADVRTVPRSRTNPQFNRDTIATSLAATQIGYEHVIQLGGLRGKQKVDPALNAYWENRSFRNYADYTQTADFAAGLQHLLSLGAHQKVAIMCAEAVWWRCHRRIIADYLLAGGHNVFHILAANHIDPASLTPAAHVSKQGVVTYPAPPTD